MNSAVMRMAARSLTPLLLLVSWVLLLRGHNEPGGGFVGGLTAAVAVLLYGLVSGADAARRRLPLPPMRLVAVGLAVALLSGLPAVFDGGAFLSGLWLGAPLPAIGKVGTPLIFDVGVYLVVLGVATGVLLELLEEPV